MQMTAAAGARDGADSQCLGAGSAEGCWARRTRQHQARVNGCMSRSEDRGHRMEDGPEAAAKRQRGRGAVGGRRGFFSSWSRAPASPVVRARASRIRPGQAIVQRRYAMRCLAVEGAILRRRAANTTTHRPCRQARQAAGRLAQRPAPQQRAAPSPPSPAPPPAPPPPRATRPFAVLLRRKGIHRPARPVPPSIRRFLRYHAAGTRGL